MEIEKLYELFKQSSGVSTDTRTIRGGELFFGLKGENFDGSKYAASALEKGASYAIVNEYAASDDERVIAMPDTLEALRETTYSDRPDWNKRQDNHKKFNHISSDKKI